jgi:hypothetical protein
MSDTAAKQFVCISLLRRANQRARKTGPSDGSDCTPYPFIPLQRKWALLISITLLNFVRGKEGTATRQRPGRKSGRPDWADIPGSGNYPRAFVVLIH